jgi:alpha,alpha-trehalose phosphorylase
MAAECGHLSLAHDYLREAALMDLRNIMHNTGDGLHIASLAGTWIALVEGFGGLRDSDGILAFAPRLPEGLSRLAISLCVRRRHLKIEVTGMTATYTLVRGEAITLVHHGTPLKVIPDEPAQAPVPPPPRREPPTQPSGREPLRFVRPGFTDGTASPYA